MAVLHKHQRQTYTVIDNQALRDEALSLRAKGLLAYLLSLPENWRINATDLSRRSTDGVQAIRSTMRELEAAGYMVYVKTQDAAGQWATTIHVAETPEILAESGVSPNAVEPNFGRAELRSGRSLRKDSEGTTDEEQPISSKVARTPNQIELDQIKDALVAVCGEPTTKTGWAVVNRAATMIRDRGGGPADVAERAALLVKDWGPAKLTLASLEKHWGRYDPGRVGRLSQAEVDAFARETEAQARSAARRARLAATYGSDE
jgi:hypothetical protein